MNRACYFVAILMSALACHSTAFADGGPLGIDSRLSKDETGPWRHSTQNAVVYGAMGLTVVGALWEGGDSRLGKTFWYSVDSGLLAGASAAVLKRAFSRPRPRDTNDPNQWFKGGGNESFPSGEVAEVSALITPFVLEYRHDHPVVYALELLPLYDAIARMKSQAHWQTDVIAGFVLGTAVGIYAHSREQPFVLHALPDGFEIGWHRRF